MAKNFSPTFSPYFVVNILLKNPIHLTVNTDEQQSHIDKPYHYQTSQCKYKQYYLLDLQQSYQGTGNRKQRIGKSFKNFIYFLICRNLCADCYITPLIEFKTNEPIQISSTSNFLKQLQHMLEQDFQLNQLQTSEQIQNIINHIYSLVNDQIIFQHEGSNSYIQWQLLKS